MPESTRTRSTATARRAQILDAAIAVFARTGFHATSLNEVAEAASISQGYVSRLFGSKQALFVATLDRCYRIVAEELERAADGAGSASPERVLEAMADAYAALIADRNLLMLQVHAQSAADVPAIREAIRRGLARLVEVALRRSRASEDQVQRFMAYGQLCHLVVTAGLDPDALGDQAWVRVLTAGLRHVGELTTP